MPPIPIDLGISSHAWIVIGGRLLAGKESVAGFVGDSATTVHTCGTEIRLEAMICAVASTKSG